jgi:ATP-dependent Clp protease ATP-binding subunit ClpA
LSVVECLFQANAKLSLAVLPAGYECLGFHEEALLAGYDFTQRVRGALIKAREEAHRRHHEYVGTEHLLLGLLEEDDTLVMDVLENLGVNHYELQTAVERVVQNGQPSGTDRMPDLPYTSRARIVLDQAIAVAHEFGDGYVGTQHLLLGLIREREGIAAHALATAGLTEPILRHEIVRLLQGEGVAAALDIDASERREETQVPLSIAVEVRYEDGTLAKKIFTTPTEAIGYLRDKSRE